MIIANTSPLIAFGQLNRFDIISALFEQIYIPTAVYQEAILRNVINYQRQSILTAIEDKLVIILEPKIQQTFRRSLGEGEIGILNLSLEHGPKNIILDDKKAR